MGVTLHFQLVSVLNLSFNGTARSSFLLGIGKFPPVTQLLCINRIDKNLLPFLSIRFYLQPESSTQNLADVLEYME